MSYMKLGTQKQKSDKTTAANQISKKGLLAMLDKKPAGKIKDKIKKELEKRVSLVKKQQKKSSRS